MNWTKTPPTKPADYRWRISADEPLKRFAIVENIEGQLYAKLCGNPTYYRIEDCGGEWAELVPAEDLAKAQAQCAELRSEVNATKNGPQKTETKSTPYNDLAELPVSLRDWFAGQALIGILSAYGPHAKQDANGLMISETVFKCAWRAADAMLAARKEKQ